MHFTSKFSWIHLLLFISKLELCRFLQTSIYSFVQSDLFSSLVLFKMKRVLAKLFLNSFCMILVQKIFHDVHPSVESSRMNYSTHHIQTVWYLHKSRASQYVDWIYHTTDLQNAARMITR